MEDKFKMLSYTHEQVQELLDKVNEFKEGFLTSKQRDKLIDEIGLDKISTFDGNYYHLDMLPIIPSRTSQLENNTTYQTEKDIIEYDEQKIQPLRNDIELLLDYIDKIDELDLDIALDRLKEVKDEISQLKNDVDDSDNLLTDLRLNVENHKDALAEANKNIDGLKKLLESIQIFYTKVIHKQIEELIIEEESQNNNIAANELSIDKLSKIIKNLNIDGVNETIKNISKKMSELNSSWIEKTEALDKANEDSEKNRIRLLVLEAKISQINDRLTNTELNHQALLKRIDDLQIEFYDICNFLNNNTITKEQYNDLIKRIEKLERQD